VRWREKEDPLNEMKMSPRATAGNQIRLRGAGRPIDCGSGGNCTAAAAGAGYANSNFSGGNDENEEKTTKKRNAGTE
jgi:hypothetical protein